MNIIDVSKRSWKQLLRHMKILRVKTDNFTSEGKSERREWTGDGMKTEVVQFMRRL
jgi:hypothetical protein